MLFVHMKYMIYMLLKFAENFAPLKQYHARL